MSNIPKIRFKGFTEDWEQRKLGECVEFLDTMRKPLKESEREKGEYPYYGASGIVDYVSDYIFDEELVLLSEDGANITDRNYPVCFLASGKYWVNNHAHVLKVNAENENNFICNSLERMDFTQYNSGMAMPKLNKDVCYNIPLFCPVYEEQKQIGDFFRYLDNLITLHQRKCDKLSKLKKLMLQKMFPKANEQFPEIRFNGFTEAWEQRKLGELGTITTGNTPSTAVPEYYSDDGIVWVTPTDISENITFNSARKLSKLGQQVGRVVPKNTILVTCIASIGKNTMLGNTGSFNQQINGLTPNENKYNPYFLLTESSLWSAQMKNSAAAGTMQIVNRTEFSELKTWLPNLVEQKQIGDLFRSLDDLITLHQRQLRDLQNIKKYMLQNMFV